MIDACPNGCDLRGKSIPEEIRHFYGATHYSRKIGIEIPGYDGVSVWNCPECGAYWPRFPEGDGRRRRIADEFIANMAGKPLREFDSPLGAS